MLIDVDSPALSHMVRNKLIKNKQRYAQNSVSSKRFITQAKFIELLYVDGFGGK